MRPPPLPYSLATVSTRNMSFFLPLRKVYWGRSAVSSYSPRRLTGVGGIQPLPTSWVKLSNQISGGDSTAEQAHALGGQPGQPGTTGPVDRRDIAEADLYRLAH